MSKSWNEDSRVKIPTVIHLARLGFKYISKNNQEIDPETNIFKEIFYQNLKRINPNLKASDFEKLYGQIKLSLTNEDLGKEFYEKYLKNPSIKLIDLRI